MNTLATIVAFALTGAQTLDVDANLTMQNVDAKNSVSVDCNRKYKSGDTAGVTATLICEDVKAEPDWDNRNFILNGKAPMSRLSDPPRLFAVSRAALVACATAFEKFGPSKPFEEWTKYISDFGMRLGFNLGERVTLQNFCQVYAQGYADGLDWALGKRKK